MQGLLHAAAETKAKQLKEHPGRQAWEAAPDWLKRTAFIQDPEILDARQDAAPLSQRMALCRLLKRQGNDAYGQDATNLALRHYVNAIAVFVWFDTGRQDGAGAGAGAIPFINTAADIPEGPEKDEVDALLAAIYNNISSCLFKLHRHQDAGFAASKALEHDPYNVKALYRRAHAHHDQATTSGLDAAVRDLKTALGLEPSNVQVRQALLEFQEELLQLKRKEAALYGPMFASGRLYEGRPATAPDGSPAPEHSGAEEDEETDDLEPVGRDRSQDPRPEHVDRMLTTMRRRVQAAQSRYQGVPVTPERRSALSYLPWWAWLALFLHVVYRMVKIWQGPVATFFKMHQGQHWPDRSVRTAGDNAGSTEL